MKKQMTIDDITFDVIIAEGDGGEDGMTSAVPGCAEVF